MKRQTHHHLLTTATKNCEIARNNIEAYLERLRNDGTKGADIIFILENILKSFNHPH